MSFIYRFKLYAFYSLNGKYETVLYRQWFVIYRCPLRQVWLYIVFFLCWHCVITGLSTFSFAPRNSNSPIWKFQLLSCKLNGSYSGTISHVKSLPKGDNPMSQKHTQYHHNYTTNHAAGKKPNLGRSLNFYFQCE